LVNHFYAATVQPEVFQCAGRRWLAIIIRINTGGRTAPMDTLLIVGGFLFIAVIGRALLNPWPSGTDEERGQLMEDIARSYF
jgi:hypothetical protein